MSCLCLLVTSLALAAADSAAKASPQASLISDVNLAQWRQLQPGDEKAASLNAIPYRAPTWTMVDGVLRAQPGSGDLMTRRRFGNYQLHLEWRNSAGGAGFVSVFLDGKYAVNLEAARGGARWRSIDIAYTHLNGQTPKSTVWLDGLEIAKDTEWKKPSAGGFEFELREGGQGVDPNNAKTGKALFAASGKQKTSSR